MIRCQKHEFIGDQCTACVAEREGTIHHFDIKLEDMRHLLLALQSYDRRKTAGIRQAKTQIAERAVELADIRLLRERLRSLYNKARGE